MEDLKELILRFCLSVTSMMVAPTAVLMGSRMVDLMARTMATRKAAQMVALSEPRKADTRAHESAGGRVD